MASYCNVTSWFKEVSGTVPGDMGSYTLCGSPPLLLNTSTKYCIIMAPGHQTVVGQCVPTSCNASSLLRFIAQNPLLNSTFIPSSYYNEDSEGSYDWDAISEKVVFCTSNTLAAPTAWAILALVVLCLAIGMVILCTAFDYFYQYSSSSSVANAPRTSQQQSVPHGRLPSQSIDQSSSTSLVAVPSQSSVVAHLDDKSKNEEIDHRQEHGENSSANHHHHSSPSPKKPLISDDASINNSEPRRTADAIHHIGAAVSSLTTKEDTPLLMSNDNAPHGSSISASSPPPAESHSSPTSRYLLSISALSCCARCIVYFSLINNFRRWRHFPRGENANVFSACRCISLFWIIVVNTFLLTKRVPSYSTRLVTSSNPLYGFLQPECIEAYAIGSFLFLSGFLTAFNLEKELQGLLTKPSSSLEILHHLKHKTKFTKFFENLKWFIFSHMGKRYLRLVPLYAAVVFLTHSVLMYWGSGPFWETFVRSKVLRQNCERDAWTNFLFINNIFPTSSDQRCFPWCYYFALEYQFYLLAPFFLWARRNFSVKGFGGMMIGILLVSIGLRAWASATASPRNGTFSNHDGDDDDDVDNNSNVYSSSSLYLNAYPHLMLAPYLIGLVLYFTFQQLLDLAADTSVFDVETARALRAANNDGLNSSPMSFYTLTLVEKIQSALEKKKNRILCIWLSVACGFLLVILEWYFLSQRREKEEGPLWYLVLLQSVNVSIWGSVLFIGLLPMMFGYGGMFRRFLCHPVWVKLSRLVFAAYLLNPIVIIFYNATRVAPAELKVLPFIYDVCGHVALTVFFSFVFHVSVEQPVIQMTESPQR